MAMPFSGLGSHQGPSGSLFCKGGGRRPCLEAQCHFDERKKAIQGGHPHVQSGDEGVEGEIGGGRSLEAKASRGGEGLA